MTEDVRHEFAGVKLGDDRRVRRLGRIVKALDAQPDVSFPEAMGTRAGSEAFYRFVEHDEVTFEALFEPHAMATADRCAETNEVLVVHDSTSFSFNGDGRQGLGKINRAGQGFHAHMSLAVSADERREPLGVLVAQRWVRTGPAPTARRRAGELSLSEVRRLPRESARWGEGVRQSRSLLSDRVSAIHVMDSEADDFVLMAELVASDERFVIRNFQDRMMPSKREGTRKVREFVAARTVVCTRGVKLSPRVDPGFSHRRRTQPRAGREAELHFRATSIELRRPTHVEKDLVASIELNVIFVTEANPPPGMAAVDWVLFTREPIDTKEQILRVVDFYRARWVIEEFFKALKTGCAFEKRQLESFQTLQNALALLLPIAWKLLRLRSLSRDYPDLPATTVLSDVELDVLFRAEHIRSRDVSLRAALLGVASLGGHIKNNGDPGWLVLGRGYQHLIAMTAGFLLAQRTCDQS